jgi:hypothetical protein
MHSYYRLYSYETCIHTYMYSNSKLYPYLLLFIHTCIHTHTCMHTRLGFILQLVFKLKIVVILDLDLVYYNMLNFTRHLLAKC